MDRDRAWRRWIEEKVVIRRLINKVNTNKFYHWSTMSDANGIHHQHPKIQDWIGSEYNFRFKTNTTKFKSNYKTKYSPNKCKMYFRYKGNGKTREEIKVEFFKILKHHGIK